MLEQQPHTHNQEQHQMALEIQRILGQRIPSGEKDRVTPFLRGFTPVPHHEIIHGIIETPERWFEIEFTDDQDRFERWEEMIRSGGPAPMLLALNDPRNAGAVLDRLEENLNIAIENWKRDKSGH